MPNVCHSLSASASFLGWLTAILAPKMKLAMLLDPGGVTASCTYPSKQLPYGFQFCSASLCVVREQEQGQ